MTAERGTMGAFRTLGFFPETSTAIVTKPPVRPSVLNQRLGFHRGFLVQGR